MQLQPARLGQGDQAADVRHRHIGFAFLDVDQLQPRAMAGHGVALEEALALDPVGRADDGDRTIGDMGQKALGDPFVIAGEVGLGDRWASVMSRPEGLAGIGQGDARDDRLALRP
ncbi:hypothetical protein D3C77_644090 [compost metagenome]